MQLSRDDMQWLLDTANDMRGMYIGHPDPTVLEEFDKRIDKCVVLLNFMFGGDKFKVER